MATSKFVRLICTSVLLIVCLLLFSCKKNDKKSNNSNTNNDIIYLMLCQKDNKYDNRYKLNTSINNTRDGKVLKRDDEPNIYDNILDELNALNKNKVTQEYKEDLSNRLDALGYNYRWNTDNSLTITTTEGEFTYGNAIDWPINAIYVNLLPIPTKGVAKDYTETDSTTIDMNWSKEEMLTYIDLLKENGFNNDVKQVETFNAYVFSAKNKDSYQVSISYTSSQSTIKIEYVTPEEGVTYEWPKEGLALLIPQPTFGDGVKIERVFDEDTSDEESVKVTVSSCNSTNFNDYCNKVKESGFNNGVESFNYGGVQSFSGYNSTSDKKVSVSLAQGMIIIEIKVIDDGPAISSNWPKTGLGSYLPVLNGKDIKVTVSDDGENETSVKIEVSSVTDTECVSYIELLRTTFIYGEETLEGSGYRTFKAYHMDQDKIVECTFVASKLTLTIYYKNYVKPNTDLPTEGIIEMIPPIDFGVVAESNIKSSSIEIKLNSVSSTQVNDYIEKVKDMGYTNNKSEFTYGSLISYTAYDASGNGIMVYYTGSQLQITFQKN